ncbi:MAG: DUF5069 domain-containing protein [Leptospirales bacterium]
MAHDCASGKMTPDPDLTTTQFFPRSGLVRIEGIPWLARMIDKGRASLSGTLGEYAYPCAMDDELLKFLGLGSDVFLDLLRITVVEREFVASLGISFRSAAERSIWSDVFLIRYARLLEELEREEGRKGIKS